MDSSYLLQAITECEQTVSNQDADIDQKQTAFKNLGNLLQGIGEFDRAIVWHSLALEKEVNIGEIYCQIGELHIVEQNWSAALISFENALEYIPKSDRIYSSLAQINGHLQQKDAEMECWYRATELNPNLVNSRGYYKLGKALEQKGKVDEAVACYQKAMTGEPSLLLAGYDLGDIYQRRGKLEQAAAIYQDILAAQPQEARAQYKLGTVYRQQGDFTAAIDAFHQTISAAPEFPWAYSDLVKTFLHLGKWDEAISTCYAILNLVEKYPWVYGHLGNALREKGRFAEAAANFQQACKHHGWSECVTKDYFFTRDLFSYKIKTWSAIIAPLQEQAIAALEIGCYQGMSACWMLDQILTGETDRLTCIDSQFEKYFQENITKTGNSDRVTLQDGNVQQLLAAMPAASFELINLQDRRKNSDDVAKNTELAWNLLKPSGLIIFNSYGWRNPRNPNHNPQAGIDRVLNAMGDRFEVVHHSPQTFQLFVRKL